MLNMTINIDQLMKYLISIKLNIQFQFGVFLRGHSGTPIDAAPALLSGNSCSTSHADGFCASITLRHLMLYESLARAVNRQPGFRPEDS